MILCVITHSHSRGAFVLCDTGMNIILTFFFFFAQFSSYNQPFIFLESLFCKKFILNITICSKLRG